MNDHAAFPTGSTVARALAVARWLNWVWMVLIVLIADNRTVETIRVDDPSGTETALRQPVVAWLAVAVVLGLCVWGTALVRSTTAGGLSRRFVAAEAVVALGLSALDGWVFDPGHVFETSQSLAAQYPLIAAASVGLAFGTWFGAGFGLLVGPFEWWGAILNDFDEFSLRHVFSLVATSVFFAAAGIVFGWLGSLLRRVERTIADQRARDEVADVLHDTVLQTLAVVEQRTATSDPELARSARQADRELRRYLFGAAANDGGDLDAKIRHAAERSARGHDTDLVVNTVGLDDRTARLTVEAEDALAGAVGEAVANAMKHAEATRVVVFVEPDDDGDRAVFASIRDDGVGFDVDAATTAGRGLDRSIRRRIGAVDGRCEVRSRPGEGTDVRLWVG